MERRDVFRLGILGLAGGELLGNTRSLMAINTSADEKGGVGRFALIGEGVLGTAARASAQRKELGFFLLIETTPPNGITPYDVSLFLQQETANGWEYVMPRKGPDGEPTELAKAYTSSLGPLVDYAVVRKAAKNFTATVSLFIPYDAMPFQGTSARLGNMRFMVRFFPWNPTQGKYALDSAFDKPFGKSAHFLHETGIRSERTFSGMARDFVIWDLGEDRER